MGVNFRGKFCRSSLFPLMVGDWVASYFFRMVSEGSSPDLVFYGDMDMGEGLVPVIFDPVRRCGFMFMLDGVVKGFTATMAKFKWG